MGRRLDADNLLNQLKKTPSLEPLYIVSGDEPLLVIESCDALRAAAGQAGYTARVSLIMDARSDWSAAVGATHNVSLFGDRRLVELAIPGGHPVKPGAEHLLTRWHMVQAQALAATTVLHHL